MGEYCGWDVSESHDESDDILTIVEFFFYDYYNYVDYDGRGSPNWLGPLAY